MSRESILKIKETEDAAEGIIEDAKFRAREMIETAEREGRALCAETETRTAEEIASTMAQLRERTDAMVDRISAEADEAAEEMRKNAMLRQRSAEKIVVRGLMSKCR
ncbi:MAG: hypothetical protein IJX80_03670 [Clostridia bacterium]|nr:hypothetical protein [Clostridia bacterium]